MIAAADDDAVRRRRRVGRWIHGLWTDGGSSDAGIVGPWLDGRLELLGLYMTFREPLCGCCFAGCDCQDGDGERHQGCCGGGLDDRRKESSPEPFVVERVHRRDLTYDDFVSRYMRTNLPVIIQGLTDDWRAAREWTIVRDASASAAPFPEGSGGEADPPMRLPNLEPLRSNFGSDIVKVMEQRHPGLGPSRPVEREMTLESFAAYWQAHHSARNGESGEVCAAGDDDSPILYLKDYQFAAKHPTYDAYEWPHCFRDDWLNLATGNAYRFVYIGPKGSSTVLHADVLRSYSWSTNVCGRKRWHLVPPAASYLLYDCFGRKLATHLRADDGELSLLFPGLARAREVAVELIQEPGETIFVPSDVFHTVENLDPTLSINHNWLNAHNLHRCWRHVRSEHIAWQEARREATCSTDISGAVQDAGQLMDDIHLWWQVVSQRVHQMQREARQLEHSPHEARRRALSKLLSDSIAIEQVLGGFRNFHNLPEVTIKQLDGLMRKLQAILVL